MRLPTASMHNIAPNLGVLIIAALVSMVLVLAVSANLDTGSVLGTHAADAATWFDSALLSKLSGYLYDQKICSDHIRDLGNTTLASGLVCIAFSIGSVAATKTSQGLHHYELAAAPATAFASLITEVDPRPPRADN